MPTYSYRCTACETAFDIHQEFTDSSLTVCPTCGGKLRKVYGAIGVSFTGSGFYRNDSRATQNGGSSGTSEKSGKSEKSEASTTPTPAAAPAASGTASSASATSSSAPGTSPTKKD
jgi:putative FmdB family regulatory protein